MLPHRWCGAVLAALAAYCWVVLLQRYDPLEEVGMCPVGTPWPIPVAATPREMRAMPREEAEAMLSGECFFSFSYWDARRRFRDAAAALDEADVGVRVEMRTLTVDAAQDLTIDVAVISPARPGGQAAAETEDEEVGAAPYERVLVHQSGVHGVEGFAGSAVQLAILNELTAGSAAAALDPSVQLVLVHVANPFGMAFMRRVNENNADLNRNFVDEKTLEELLQRPKNIGGYEDLSPFFNPKQFPSRLTLVNDVLWWLRAVEQLVRFSVLDIKRALVSGQYHNPRGVGYGGSGFQKSVELIQATLRELVPPTAQRASFIDVHTGLGAPGVDTLMIDGGHTKEEDALRWFPEEAEGGYGFVDGGSSAVGAAAGYDLTRGDAPTMCTTLVPPTAQKVCFTQEFGTVPMHEVLFAQLNENQAWHYGTPQQKRVHARRLLNVFYVQTRAWKRSVVRRGLVAFHQAQEFLTHVE